MGNVFGLPGDGENKKKRIKGAEWAVLLLVLGLAGSLLVSAGPELFGNSAPEPRESPRDALEARLSRVLSRMEGAGAVEVVIHYAAPAAVRAGNWFDMPEKEESGEPIGALIIAEGAGDLKVRLELARAVQTLLQLDVNAVEIFKMEAEIPNGG